jgi:hypothetical protein
MFVNVRREKEKSNVNMYKKKNNFQDVNWLSAFNLFRRYLKAWISLYMYMMYKILTLLYYSYIFLYSDSKQSESPEKNIIFCICSWAVCCRAHVGKLIIKGTEIPLQMSMKYFNYSAELCYVIQEGKPKVGF